jgi:FkbM family methyltransferase
MKVQFPDGVVVVQIGTNDGNDEFCRLCMSTRISLSKVILVEPNKDLNKFIEFHYAKIANKFIENVAITDVNTGMVKLYLPKELVDEEKTKKDERYATGHFSLKIPTEYYGVKTEAGKTIEVPSMTFEELCEKYSIKDIYFLQIDAEGYDEEIIKSIDFEKHNIHMIQYESTAKWESEPIVAFLESKGYYLVPKMEEGLDVIALKVN